MGAAFSVRLILVNDLEKLKNRLSQIKLIAIEVDGVLTDGRVWQAADGQFRRVFSIRDAMGIRLLKKSGYRVVFFSFEASEDISRHALALGVDLFVAGDFQGTQSAQNPKPQAAVDLRFAEPNGHPNISVHSLVEEMRSRFKVQSEEILSFLSAGTTGNTSIGIWPKEVLKCSVAKSNSQELHFCCRGDAGEGVVRELSQILLKFRKTENDTARTTASL